MVVDIAAQVEQVLTRAASLFAAPFVDDVADGGDLGTAVTTVRGLGEVAQSLGGDVAESVNVQVSQTLAVLSKTEQRDRAILERLAAVAAAHGWAAQEASTVLAVTQEISASALELASTPAGEVAVLRQLRDQVASMERLMSVERRRAADAVSGDSDSGRPAVEG